MATAVHRLLRRRVTITGEISPSSTNPIKSLYRNQTSLNSTNSRNYIKLTDLFRKSKDFTTNNEISSSILNSPFSSSNSTSISSITSSFVGWYLDMVKNRPILTKSVTCSLIYIAADLSSQTIVNPASESYDVLRTLRMAGYGMVVLGPSLHFWFSFVSRRFPKRDLITTFKKIVLGQTVFGPVMTALFFSTNACLQGESGSEIVARLKRDMLPTMVNGVMYWPVCDFITFKFIPVHLQPLMSNSFSYLWTVYMTYMASQEKVNSSGSAN